jgi:hypothetical protein
MARKPYTEVPRSELSKRGWFIDDYGQKRDLAGGHYYIAEVPVADIHLGEGRHYVSARTDKVMELIESLKAGKKLPLVEVTKKGDKIVIMDGNHRFMAAKAIGTKSIPAILAKQWKGQLI